MQCCHTLAQLGTCIFYISMYCYFRIKSVWKNLELTDWLMFPNLRTAYANERIPKAHYVGLKLADGILEGSGAKTLRDGYFAWQQQALRQWKHSAVVRLTEEAQGCISLFARCASSGQERHHFSGPQRKAFNSRPNQRVRRALRIWKQIKEKWDKCKTNIKLCTRYSVWWTYEYV